MSIELSFGFSPVLITKLAGISRGVIFNSTRRLLGLAHNDVFSPDQGAKMSRKAKDEMLHYLWQFTMGIPAKQNTLPGQTDDADSHDQTHEEIDSDDDSRVGEGSYPEISAAIAFLKDGAPMQTLQEEMRGFILNAAWKHDVLGGSKSWPLSLLKFVDDLWNVLRPIFPEPSIPRGKQRIRWTCVS